METPYEKRDSPWITQARSKPPPLTALFADGGGWVGAAAFVICLFVKYSLTVVHRSEVGGHLWG